MDFLKKLGSGLVEEATEKLQTTLTEGASDAMSSLTGSVTKSLLGKAAGAAENVMESLSPQIDEAFNGARDNAKQELGAKLVGHAEKAMESLSSSLLEKANEAMEGSGGSSSRDEGGGLFSSLSTAAMSQAKSALKDAMSSQTEEINTSLLGKAKAEPTRFVENNAFAASLASSKAISICGDSFAYDRVKFRVSFAQVPRRHLRSARTKASSAIAEDTMNSLVSSVTGKKRALDDD